MAEIPLDEYYRLSAENFDAAKDLVRAMEAELPECWRTNVVIRACLDTHDFDEAIAFMGLAMAANGVDVLSDAAYSSHNRHKIRNELNGICGVAYCLTGTSSTRGKILTVMEHCRRLSYRDGTDQ